VKIRRRALLRARILGTPHSSPPTSMSSTTTSLSNFSSILDAALDSYAKQTGIDLTNHPFADKLQNCRSPDDILQILSERESAFKDHRDKYRNLIDHVRPIVQVVHVFSNVLGEAAVLVSSGAAFSTSNRMFTPEQAPLQPTKAIFVGVDVLLSVYISLLLSTGSSYDTHLRRLLLASVQAMMRLLTSLNASRISLGGSIFIQRRFRCPPRCLISWSR
jgi:hypothetical protein